MPVATADHESRQEPRLDCTVKIKRGANHDLSDKRAPKRLETVLITTTWPTEHRRDMQEASARFLCLTNSESGPDLWRLPSPLTPSWSTMAASRRLSVHSTEGMTKPQLPHTIQGIAEGQNFSKTHHKIHVRSKVSLKDKNVSKRTKFHVRSKISMKDKIS